MVRKRISLKIAQSDGLVIRRQRDRDNVLNIPRLKWSPMGFVEFGLEEGNGTIVCSQSLLPFHPHLLPTPLHLCLHPSTSDSTLMVFCVCVPLASCLSTDCSRQIETNSLERLNAIWAPGWLWESSPWARSKGCPAAVRCGWLLFQHWFWAVPSWIYAKLSLLLSQGPLSYPSISTRRSSQNMPKTKVFQELVPRSGSLKGFWMHSHKTLNWHLDPTEIFMN